MTDREYSAFEFQLYEKVKGDLTNIQSPAMLKDLIHVIRVGLELGREMVSLQAESAKLPSIAVLLVDGPFDGERRTIETDAAGALPVQYDQSLMSPKDSPTPIIPTATYARTDEVADDGAPIFRYQPDSR